MLSVDVGAVKNGYYGDAAKTFAVGKISDEKKKLMEVTEKALQLGIENAIAGNHVEDISQAIQDYVEENGFSVVRDLVGHGIGTKLHEDPACSELRQERKRTVVEKWNDARNRTDGQCGRI